MNRFDEGLLESGNLMRRGYSFLTENSGKAIAILTALIAILLTFTDIAIPRATLLFTDSIILCSQKMKIPVSLSLHIFRIS